MAGGLIAPEEPGRMADLSREFGARLTRLRGERAYIDEIPIDQPVTQALSPECDFLCSLAEQQMVSEVGVSICSRQYRQVLTAVPE